jgi:hypothetical protein
MYFKQNKVVITSLNVTQIGLTRKFLPKRFHEIGSRRFRFRRPSSTFPAATAWRSSSWSSRPRPCRRSGSSLTTWPGADPSKHDRTVFFLFVTALHHSASVVVVNGAGSKSLNLQYVHMWKMQLTKDFLWCALAAWSEASGRLEFMGRGIESHQGIGWWGDRNFPVTPPAMQQKDRPEPSSEHMLSAHHRVTLWECHPMTSG